MKQQIIIDTKGELFQWEKDRYVYIEQSDQGERVYCVQFYNKKSQVAEEDCLIDGKVKIPNKLLTQNIPITVIACGEQGDGTRVLAQKSLRVLPRTRPMSYIDDDDEPILLFGGNANA